jgi:hypothetical protein
MSRLLDRPDLAVDRAEPPMMERPSETGEGEVHIRMCTVPAGWAGLAGWSRGNFEARASRTRGRGVALTAPMWECRKV